MNRRTLSLAVFGFVVLSFALNPQSPIITHALSDPDDYMRLHQVANWLSGQGWFDTSVPRLVTGTGDAARHTIVHWSRLVDLPIAAVAAPFLPFFGMKGALLTASFIVPLLWLAGMLALLPILTRLLRPDATGQRAASWTPVFLLCAPFLLFDLSPGRVDHHGAQAVMASLGLCGFALLMRGFRPRLAALCLAISLSCGLWIGTEALAWSLPLLLCAGVCAPLSDEPTRRGFALFGLLWPAITTLLLYLALPAPFTSGLALSWFSPAFLLLAVLGGAVFIGGYRLSRARTARVRLAAYGALGILAVVGFAFGVPAAANGPFADYHAFNATTGLQSISEAQPILSRLALDLRRPMTFAASGLIFAKLVFLPLLACAGCLWFARRAGNHATRLLWSAQGFLIAAPLTAALVWQARVDLFAQLFMLPALAVLFVGGRNALALRFNNRRLFATEILLFLILGPLPVVLLPSFAASRPVFPDIALFPANRGKPTCDLTPVLLALNDGERLGKTAHRILNTGNDGPQLLFATRHEVIAANYDAPGNPAAYAALSAKNDEAARSAIAATGADLVLICKATPLLYVGKDYFSINRTQLTPGPDGKLRLVNTDAEQPLVRRLIDGQAPAWLKPIEIPDSSDYLLFAFDKP